MINNLFIFLVSLFFVIKGATLAIKYSEIIAKSYNLSKYAVGFIVVAILSILPETFISVSSALNDIPAFGLGMLFGSNIADLTIIFALIIFLTGRSLKIESKIIKNNGFYPFALLLPLVLGLDGYYSRIEGLALVLIGGVFYYIAFKNGTSIEVEKTKDKERYKNFLMLLLSMVLLLAGAHFTVVSATAIAGYLNISPILIGMLVVGLGTTMPEFFFSLNSARKNDDELAVGDMLGTVLADATVVVGVIALINPFSFSTKIIYVTGMFMVVASFVLFRFMRSGRTLTKKEASILFVFWLVFVLVEFLVSK